MQGKKTTGNKSRLNLLPAKYYPKQYKWLYNAAPSGKRHHRGSKIFQKIFKGLIEEDILLYLIQVLYDPRELENEEKNNENYCSDIESDDSSDERSTNNTEMFYRVRIAQYFQILNFFFFFSLFFLSHVSNTDIYLFHMQL